MVNMISSCISDELVVLPYKNGIKLFRPEEVAHFFDGDSIEKYSLSNMLKQNGCVSLLDTMSQAIHINDEGLEVCGHKSLKDSIGKTMADVADRQTATIVLQNQKRAINSQSLLMVDEDIFMNYGLLIQSVGVLIPWFQDSLMGLLSFNIVIGKHSLADFFNNLFHLNLIYSNTSPLQKVSSSKILEHTYLSKREQQCLMHYTKGKTAKQIALLLNLSCRTIESYLENIREKLGVSSKMELIDLINQN